MKKTKKAIGYSELLEKLSRRKVFKISAKDLNKEQESIQKFDEAMCRQLSISQKILEMEVSI
jgi:phage FluMu protein gp41